MKNTILFLLVGLVAINASWGFNIHAQEGATGITIGGGVTPTPDVAEVLKEEEITPLDLGVVDSGLLPTSPFYFLKNWGRGIRMFLTFNPVAKAELELKFANEKIAEAKVLVEREPQRADAILRAIENYRVSQERLKVRFETLRDTSQNPRVDKLLENLAERTVKHEKLFAELGEKFIEEKPIRDKIDEAKIKIEESIAEAAKKDEAQKFARKLERALVEEKGSDFKHVRSLEILDRIHDKADEKLKEELGDIREDFSQRLKEDLEEFTAKHVEEAPQIIREALERLPGDKERQLVILGEIRERAEKKLGEALKDTEKALEDLFKERLKEREEFKKRAEEAIKRAEEQLRKLEEKLAEVSDVSAAVKRLLAEAKNNLEEARRAFEEGNYGETFGQARSAEVIARNVLRIFEELKEPDEEDGEDLKEEISEMEERLRGWEQRFEVLPEDLRAKAEEVLAKMRFHLRQAAENFAKGDLLEVKKHLEEVKTFARVFERIFRESFRRKERPIAPTFIREGERREIAETGCCIANVCAVTNGVQQCLNAGGVVDSSCSIDNVGERCGTAAVPTPSVPPRPTIRIPEETLCTLEYDPVCGVDGKTYSNACFAKVAGVEIKYRGECGRPIEEPAAIKPSPTLAKPKPLPITPTLPLVTPVLPVAPALFEFKVEADDNGFYPSSVIAVPKGSKVKLHFIVRSTNVYFGGLDFRSDKFRTESVKPGGTTSVEFLADGPLVITSYWPASGVRKADLRVEVK